MHIQPPSPCYCMFYHYCWIRLGGQSLSEMGLRWDELWGLPLCGTLSWLLITIMVLSSVFWELNEISSISSCFKIRRILYLNSKESCVPSGGKGVATSYRLWVKNADAAYDTIKLDCWLCYEADLIGLHLASFLLHRGGQSKILYTQMKISFF